MTSKKSMNQKKNHFAPRFFSSAPSQDLRLTSPILFTLFPMTKHGPIMVLWAILISGLLIWISWPDKALSFSAGTFQLPCVVHPWQLW